MNVLFEEIVACLKSLREEIIASFESLEPKARFERKPWNYASGSGGGEIALLRGNHFEKAAVNFSAIEGSSFPTQEACGPFFATGISLITHMKNPHAPTVHMNVRFISGQDRSWVAGGYDLTPMGIFYPEDTSHFHHTAQTTLDSFDTSLYPIWRQNAKEYFYIPHRGKERGVGGIFFDHFNTGNWPFDFSLLQAVGKSLIPAVLPIWQKRIDVAYSEREKALQQQWRAHYVEFNLLYDRGTKFGFLSNGNPEAILCSMPPFASWS